MRKIVSRIAYWLYFKEGEYINEYQFIETYLKKKGYDKNGYTFTKGFIVIDVRIKPDGIESISIVVDKISPTRQYITDGFISGLAENYYSRL